MKLRGIEEFVNRQVREWEQRARGTEVRVSAPASAPTRAVTVSRQAGTGGEAVSREVAARLGAPLFDREILSYIAREAHVLESVVRTVDERGRNWVEETLDTLFSTRHISRSEYLEFLSRAVLSVAQHGPAVIVGRGAERILPPERRLAVRIVAPEEWRARRFAEERDISVAEAREQVRHIDQERRNFVQNHFRVSVDEPWNYDMVLNAATLPPAVIAAAVAAAYHQQR